MPKLPTPKADQPVCYHCHIPIREIRFAYWVNGKPHCSASCASHTKDKMQKVNRWKKPITNS